MSTPTRSSASTAPSCFRSGQVGGRDGAGAEAIGDGVERAVERARGRGGGGVETQLPRRRRDRSCADTPVRRVARRGSRSSSAAASR